MITSAAIAFATSSLLFIVLLISVHKERRRGRRFFATKFRDSLDRVINKVGDWIVNSWNHFVKYIVQLHWYYSIHSLLRTLLRVIVTFYTYFENVFERNRSRTKQLRAEKRQLSELNHLRQMTDHKEDTALTPAQKRKLKHKKLEGKH
ncbi:MAG: hypothetical protein LR008_02320 [Candidatus Pacebacteria bacterium]|nr:hypothetical protein [Candidatus Paceibacterota bacterium]